MSLKIRRGTNSERLTIIPDEGELLYTVDTKKIFVGDGATTGGTMVTGGLSGNLADNLYLDNHSIIGTNLIVNGQTGSITAASVTAHLRGSVYADDSTVLVDSIQGKVVGPIDVDVTSVRIAGGTNGQVLTTNGNGVISWSNKSNALISLANLTDISLFNVRSNDILKFNGTNWVNSPNTNFVGDVQGSVFSDFSTKLVDGTTGFITNGTIGLSGEQIISSSKAINFGWFNLPGTLKEVIFNFTEQSISPIQIRNIAGAAGSAAFPKLWFEAYGTKLSRTQNTLLAVGTGLGAVGFRGINPPSTGGAALPASVISSIIDPNGSVNSTYITGKIILSNSFGPNQLTDYKHLTFDSRGYLAINQLEAQATCDINGVMRLAPQSTEPSPKVEGMIAVADRASWDPASKGSGGSYPVYYNGSSWNALF
jgi:hypothetical protein